LPLCVKQITPNVKAMEIADLGVCLLYVYVNLSDSIENLGHMLPSFCWGGRTIHVFNELLSLKPRNTYINYDLIFFKM